MAESSTLKLHEVCSVAPPQGTTETTTLPLTFFDILWLRLPPVERLFFYEFPTTTSIFFDSVLPKLKHSLDITLQNFVPLAGNIIWPHDSKTPLISYVPGDSVPLTVVESTEDFTLLCSNLCEVSKRNELVPRLKKISHEKASLLALQVSLFQNRGFCVGITSHHAGADGKCSTLFMKAWAYTCRKLLKGDLTPLPANLTPFFDRSVIKDTKGVTEVYRNVWLNMGGENNRSLMVWETLQESQSDAVKGHFELTPSQIQKLKKYAQSMVNGKVSKLSTFSVTCAYLLSCLVKVEKVESNKVAFIFSVDCRSRLDPPIDANYFGNCILPRLFWNQKSGELLGSNDWFIKTFVEINELLVGLDQNGVVNEALDWMPKVNAVYGGGNRVYSTAGSPRFEVYGIDFGRPKKVDVTSVDRTGAFALSESRDVNGGVEIGLALSNDKLILYYKITLKLILYYKITNNDKLILYYKITLKFKKYDKKNILKENL